MGDKVFWIGDDGDFKCVKAGGKIIGRGKEIPAGTLSDERIEEFREKGLIAIGDKAAPVVIKDTETIKNLETEIVSLKRENDCLPGLHREIIGLKKSAEKAKGGAKAKQLREKDDHITELEANAIKQSERIKELEDDKAALELDNQEKAALIDKLNADLGSANELDTGGAGPGGSK